MRWRGGVQVIKEKKHGHTSVCVFVFAFACVCLCISSLIRRKGELGTEEGGRERATNDKRAGEQLYA